MKPLSGKSQDGVTDAQYVATTCALRELQRRLGVEYLLPTIDRRVTFKQRIGKSHKTRRWRMAQTA